MNQQPGKMVDLSDVRREIDEIDDGILRLLQNRFDVVAKVKMAKAQEGNSDQLPLRPAREAMILRRLTENNDSRVPDDLILQLWRSIICHSTLAQAPVQINVSSDLFDQRAARETLTRHFVDFPLKPYNKIKMALNSAAKSNFELCAFSATSNWLDHLDNEKYCELSVILTLPFTGEKETGHLIILGKTSNEPTGDDETLLVSKGRLPRDFVPAPLWEVKTTSGQTLTSLPGYVSTSESPLVGLISGNADLALKVLGRYPSPFEV